MEDVSESTSGNNCIIITKTVKDLPVDIIMEILSWLPIEHLLRCKCVCKGWQRIIEHSDFINLQLRRSISLPLRTIVRVSAGRLSLLDLDQKKAREISSMNHKMSDLSKIYLHRSQLIVMSSCNGFLCLASEWSLDPVVVSNPITTEYVVLPKSGLSYRSLGHHVCLGFDLSAKKYKAVRTHSNFNLVTGFEIFTLGEPDSSWRKVEASYRVLVLGNVRPLYSKGALYWILDKTLHKNTNEYILVLNLSNETFKTVVFPPNLVPDMVSIKIQLFNLGGYVTLVQVNYMLLQMWRIMSDGDGDFHVHHSIGIAKTRRNGFLKEGLTCNMDKDSSFLKVICVSHDTLDLCQYFPERMEYERLNIDGLPKWFSCIPIRPNLISPPNCGSGAE